MNAIKEFFKLAKMLFKDKPSDHDKVELISMDHFPFKGYLFMMWCGKVIYRSEKEGTIHQYVNTKKGKESINHETIHLYQAKDKKTWIKYYLKYIQEWLKGNPITHPSSSAYYTIPYEMEAYANESNFNYLETRTKDSVNKYDIKDRKKTYKAHRNDWKQYIKTL